MATLVCALLADGPQNHERQETKYAKISLKHLMCTRHSIDAKIREKVPLSHGFWGRRTHQEPYMRRSPHKGSLQRHCRGIAGKVGGCTRKDN